MISDLVLILAGLLVLAGSAFAAIAALGILRLPDVYTRMHSASKAGAVGAGMLLLALALTSDSTPAALRALAAVVFILLTAPLAAHLLAKAAYSVGYELGPESVLDEMPPPQPRNVGSPSPDSVRDAPPPVVDRA
ncbi:MAG TPA: monovalent cation/H(+) antiporter subunit G [Aurantimonas sp.]|jgi:multicomponent Na+:H+ antiporter subunit G|nr:monovalent cation/H(+) antiporter subunit G [Aurantimonas sp.]